MSETWTPPKLVAWIKEELARRGLDGNLRLEAELLVAQGLKIERIDIYLRHDQPLSEPERAQVRELVRRRFAREPLGYILGEAHFWTLELAVGPGVLCPRPDTETLVEALLHQAPKTGVLRAAELGLGSGAISLAFGLERGQLEIDGVEKSPQAAAYARTNIQRYQEALIQKNVVLNLIEADGLGGLEGPYDLIYSNPPYIAAAEMATLEPEVRDYEPLEALEAPEEGLAFYRHLFEQSLRLLAPGGMLAFEHGWQQKELIQTLAPPEFHLIAAIQDLTGKDRVLLYQTSGAA
ncbi:MAG: peptide chain release factor N(5)-glutamine methyltransferase [bacterium]|nr:peptide chain release factor N(5)-glutamine methyltransferase [bacterium]